jgi:hypothetical protein
LKESRSRLCTVLEMETVLGKACQSLPPELVDKHEVRTFIASWIIESVLKGERILGGMVCAGLSAIAELNPDFKIA